MIEKFVSLVERIAIALEKIASSQGAVVAAPEAPADVTPAKKAVGSRKTAATPPAPPAAPPAAPAAPAPADSMFDDEPPAAPAKKYERNDVRVALENAGKRVGDMGKAFAVLTGVGGVSKLSELSEGKYAAVIDAANALS